MNDLLRLAGVVDLDAPGLTLEHRQRLAAWFAAQGAGAVEWRAADAQAWLGVGTVTDTATLPSLPTRQAAPESATSILLFDGRIDNLSELRRQLSLPPAGSDAHSTLETLQTAYALWGMDFLKRLVGEFALALWHSRERRLCLARDVIGHRPLYWLRTGSRLAFGSEETGLSALLGQASEPNWTRLAALLDEDFAWYDPEEAWIAGVFEVLPGQCLEFGPQGRFERRVFADLEPPPPLNLASEAEYDEAFRETLLEAVRCRLAASDRPLLMLSGGIDSLSVLGAARQLEREGKAPRLATASLIRRTPDCLESRNIRATATGYEDSTHLLPVDSPWTPEASDSLLRALRHFPHPVDGSIPSVQWLAMLGRAWGYRQLFSGAGGDLALHSPSHYFNYPGYAASLDIWLNEVRLARRHHAGWKWADSASFGKAIGRRFIPSPLLRWRQSRAARQSPMKRALNDIAPGPCLTLELHLAELNERRRQAQGDAAAEHRLALETGSLRCGLRGYGQTGARHGLLHLDPWSDVRMIRFCQALPLRQRVGQGWYKWLARRATGAWLPEPCRWHSEKMHLGRFVIEHALRTDPLCGSVNGPKPGRGEIERALANVYSQSQVPGTRLDASASLAWIERLGFAASAT